MKTSKTNLERRSAKNAMPRHAFRDASYTDRNQIAVVPEDLRRDTGHGSSVILDLISLFEVVFEPNWMRFLPKLLLKALEL